MTARGTGGSMTTSGKPVMLLDLDGVINALTKTIGIPGLPDSIRTVPPMLNRSWPEDAWRTGDWVIDGVKFPLLWSVQVLRELTFWHTSGLVDIRWHTTWREEALDVAEKLFKLPGFYIADCPEWPAYVRNEGMLRASQIREGRPGWWKYMAAERVLTEEKRPLIWVDDDLNLQLSRFYQNKMSSMGAFLGISPTPAIGLVHKHIRSISHFIADHTEKGQP